MVDSIWAAMGNIAKPGVLIGLIVLAVIIWIWFFERYKKVYAETGARTFDGRVGGFNPAEARNDLAKFSEKGLKTYSFQARVVDMIFPIVYALAAAVLIRLAAPNLGSLRWLILLPFITALFDWLENLCVGLLIGRFKSGASFGSLPVVLLVFQRLKWLMFGALAVVLLILTIGWIRRSLA